MAELDVCIRGAGPVGSTLALLLAQQRLRVGLVAGATPVEADIRAFALNAASRTVLDSLRCWPDGASPVAQMQVHGDAGGMVRFDAAAQGLPALAWVVDAQGLTQRLHQAVAFQPQITRFAEPQAATLTVVCEGKASDTRTQFNVDFEVTPYEQTAIAARLSCELPHAQTAHQWFSQGEVLALLPLLSSGNATDSSESAEALGNSVALVWSVDTARAQDLMALEGSAFCEQLQAACGQVLGPMQLLTERAAWPLQLARAKQWVGPGWALAGDAAHTVHPLAGQGLNLGLADAAGLAQVLRDRQGADYWRSVADKKLLRRYARARQTDALALGLATDGLQQLFAQTAGPWVQLRNLGMNGFEALTPLKKWVAQQAAGRS